MLDKNNKKRIKITSPNRISKTGTPTSYKSVTLVFANR